VCKHVLQGDAQPRSATALHADRGVARGRRFTTARGGIEVGGERERLAPRTTISKINIFSDGGLGLSDIDKRRVHRAVAFFMSDISEV